jgi:hypothetical protein
MRLIAVVDPIRGSEHALSPELLECAYFASRHGAVAIAAPRDRWSTIERALDTFVLANRRVFGVVFRDPNDAGSMNGSDDQTLFVGDSANVRSAAATVGARCVEPNVGLKALHEWSSRSSLDGRGSEADRLAFAARREAPAASANSAHDRDHASRRRLIA